MLATRIAGDKRHKGPNQGLCSLVKGPCTFCLSTNQGAMFTSESALHTLPIHKPGVAFTSERVLHILLIHKKKQREE